MYSIVLICNYYNYEISFYMGEYIEIRYYFIMKVAIYAPIAHICGKVFTEWQTH